jgi:mannose-6-phosphate isomerase-like protein (cupin superfamily)
MDNTAFRLRKADATRAFSLSETFVHLKDLGQANSVSVGPEFWSTIDTRTELQVGRLLGRKHWEKDMGHWEMHPSGDELLFAVSGEFEILLQDGRTDHVVPLTSGQAYLVPYGVWHRVRVKSAGEMLFVTPGKGTQQRAL